MNFQYVKCNRCNFLIGLFLKEQYYFIKSMIKTRKSKQLFLELISIKSELLKEFKSDLDSIYKNNIVNVDINIHLIKKDSISFDDYTKKRFDIIFIIHKIEGRMIYK